MLQHSVRSRNMLGVVIADDHQMSYFKAKMHQIRFRLGLRPTPLWGAYSAPPDNPSWI